MFISFFTEMPGCPFRHFEESRLRAKLLSKRIAVPQIDEIMGLVKNTHFQVESDMFNR